ncbi:MAG: FAD:protein FMN transferase [Planctomycetaceae bacterium]|nr:FAD:protein FMN transferase [Planctomycetaceae bacterium]
MDRRDFFQSFRKAEYSELDSVSVPLLVVSREAMAGEFAVSFDKTLYPWGTEIALAALDEVQRLERKLSVFLPDSQVSFINKVASFSPVSLDEELFDLVQFCLDLSEQTGGAIDITSTPLWKLWGFADKKVRIPTAGEIAAALETVGTRFVELDETAGTIRFTKPGVQLSFGCVGKGLALDAASRVLENAGMRDFQIHGGLSSVLTRGNFRRSEPGWTLGVAHPIYPEQRLAEIRLLDESLGTSGSQKQFFLHQNRRYGHILDPRTGYPSEHTLMVTVVAGSAMLADVLSTAFYVMPPTEVETYCAAHPDVAALLVLASDQNPQFEVRSFGLPDEKIRWITPSQTVDEQTPLSGGDRG